MEVGWKNEAADIRLFLNICGDFKPALSSIRLK
jgi:hypothetical protein